MARTTLINERSSAAAGKGRGVVTVAAGSVEGNLDRTVGDLIELSRRAVEDPTKRTELLLSSRSMIALARDVGVVDDGATRDRLMRYYVHSEVYRLNGQRSRDLAKTGRPGPDGSMMKLDLAMLAHESRDLSLSMIGAEGMLMGADSPRARESSTGRPVEFRAVARRWHQ